MGDEASAASLASKRGGLCSGFLLRKERLERAITNAKSLKTDYAVDKMRKALDMVLESFYKIEDCIIQEDVLDLAEVGNKKRKESLEKYAKQLQEVESKCDEAEKLLTTPAAASATQRAHATSGPNPGMPKANDLLKPQPLEMDDKPSVLRQFKKDYKIFYNHYKMESFDLEEQQAYFTHCLAKKLHARIAPKIRGATPVMSQPKDSAGNEPESCFKLLEDEFRKNYPIVRRRRDFFEHRQQTGQSWADWNIQLKELAQEAELQDIQVDDLIMHMQLELTTDQEIRNKFLQQPNPKMEELETIASSIEQARRSQEGRKAQINAASGQSKVKIPCWRCTWTNHPHHKCKFIKNKCKNCGDIGHILSACWKDQSKGKVNKAEATTEADVTAEVNAVKTKPAVTRRVRAIPATTPAKVARVTMVDSKGRAVKDNTDKATPRMAIEVTDERDSSLQRSTLMSCLPDCGAMQSIINADIVKKHGFKGLKSKGGVPIIAADGNPMPCEGSIELVLDYQGKKILIEALVSSALNDHLLVCWHDLVLLDVLPKEFPNRIGQNAAAHPNGIGAVELAAKPATSQGIMETRTVKIDPSYLRQVLEQAKQENEQLNSTRANGCSVSLRPQGPQLSWRYRPQHQTSTNQQASAAKMKHKKQI